MYTSMVKKNGLSSASVSRTAILTKRLLQALKNTPRAAANTGDKYCQRGYSKSRELPYQRPNMMIRMPMPLVKYSQRTSVFHPIAHYNGFLRHGWLQAHAQ